MAVLPWSRPDTMYPSTFIAEVVMQGNSCRMWCLCRKSPNQSQHQSLFSRSRFIVQKSHGPDCPVAGTSVFLRHASSDRRQPLGKTVEPLTVQHRICPYRDGRNFRQNGQAIKGRSDHRNTNPCRHPPDVQLVLRQASVLAHGAQENGLCFVPRSLVWSSFNTRSPLI